MSRVHNSQMNCTHRPSISNSPYYAVGRVQRSDSDTSSTYGALRGTARNDPGSELWLKRRLHSCTMTRTGTYSASLLGRSVRHALDLFSQSWTRIKAAAVRAYRLQLCTQMTRVISVNLNRAVSCNLQVVYCIVLAIR
jgi:hypothetical protein